MIKCLREDEWDKDLTLAQHLRYRVATCVEHLDLIGKCLWGFYSLYGTKLSGYPKTTALNQHDQIFRCPFFSKAHQSQF